MGIFKKKIVITPTGASEKARFSTLGLRAAIKKLSTKEFRKARKSARDANPVGTPAEEAGKQDKSEAYGSIYSVRKQDWHHPGPIVKALVDLNSQNKVAAHDVIKFETLGDMSPEVKEKLQEYLADGYLNAGIVVMGSNPASKWSVVRAGKRATRNAWYYRVWKSLTKKRSLKFWKKKKTKL